MPTAAGTEAVLQGCDPDTDPPLMYTLPRILMFSSTHVMAAGRQ